MPIELKCSDIHNGKLCVIPDGHALDKIIGESRLVSTRSMHKNGERVLLETDSGEWFGTAIKYTGNDGKYYLIKKR
jgi:hypothetical protein